MDRTPVVIGLYGLPGSGKSCILRALREHSKDYLFFDGSSEINAITPGGLAAFKEMRESEKTLMRKAAIRSIQKKAVVEAKPAVISGHAIFWLPDSAKGAVVFTDADAEVYSRIIYLKTDPEQILQFREKDRGRNRVQETLAVVERHQQEEYSSLKELCLQSGIIFHMVSSILADERRAQVATILRLANLDNASENKKRVEGRVDEISTRMAGEGAVFLIDCDRTLAPVDTGAAIWKELSKRNNHLKAETLKTIFSSRLGYSPTAFRQAAISYAEALNEGEQMELEEEILASVEMYPAMLAFVTKLRHTSHQVIFLTCGLASLWERILEKHNLDNSDVIGAGRGLDGLIVTPQTKADVLHRLRTIFPEKRFIAIGDGPTDIEMLKAADEGVVIVGDSNSRSSSVDGMLYSAITEGRCSFQQVLMDPYTAPRLDLELLPLGDLETLLEDLPSQADVEVERGLRVIDLSETSVSKLLATNMRDAKIAGPALRDAHREAGYYLAMAQLSKLTGLEKKPLRHVLGHETTGSRFKDERKTLIVALMRGGEPMAFGVNDALPEARFRHAKEVDDLKSEHLANIKNVVLVDSVINTGKTIIDFAKRVHELASGSREVRVFVIAGVVQDQAVRADSALCQELAAFKAVHLIALRLSPTSFVGTRATDTGNRLFNTTNLD